MAKTPKKNCPMQNCWKEISAKASLCAACASWWRRVSLYNPSELGRYMQRVGRFAGRLGHLKQHRPGKRAA